MNPVPDIKQAGKRKSPAIIWLFFYRWSALLVLLYGLLGFLFYFFLLTGGHAGATTSLSYRALPKNVLWDWLLVFAVLHLAVFAGGLLLLLYNKVWGFILFIIAMPSILLANAVINHEINFTSWGILAILGFFLWKGLNCKG